MNRNKLKIQSDELVDNPSARLPVCVALDTSYSMDGAPLRELQFSIEAFFDAVRTDEMARITADIALLKYGGTVENLSPFSSVDSQPRVQLIASGDTPMGGAILQSLQLLEDRKRELSHMGVDYYQPWLVLLTDGLPTDPGDLRSAYGKCRNLIESGKLTVLSIAIGDDADMRVLEDFSSSGRALRIGHTDLKPFFQWLSKSITVVSMSNPGESGSSSIVDDDFAKVCANPKTLNEVFGY